MRKYIIIIGLFLSITTFSQNSKKVHYSFDFGPSLSIPSLKMYETSTEIENHPVRSFRSDLGFFIDAFIEYKFSNKFSLTSGIGYLYNNLKINDKIGYEEGSGHIKYSSLNAPLIFKCSLIKNIPLSFGAGIYAAFKINVKEKGTTILDTSKLFGIDRFGHPARGYYLGIDPKRNYNNNITTSYKRFDFGFLAQIEYDFRLTEKLSCVVLTRFNLGLINTFNYQNAYEWRDYNFQIGLGFKY
jgi:hypothetical protein